MGMKGIKKGGTMARRGKIVRYRARMMGKIGKMVWRERYRS